MTARSRTYFVIVLALVLLVGIPMGVRQYRIARTAAFCEAVGELPAAELAEFADRCDLLLWERDGPGAETDIIRDSKVLARFALVRRTPYEIVVGRGNVMLKYFRGHWSYSDGLMWGVETDDRDGHPIQVLKLAYGTYGWRILHRREAGRHSWIKIVNPQER